MGIKTSIKASAESSSLKPVESSFSGDFPSVSEADVEEGVRNYLQIVKEDTGVKFSKKKRKRVSVKKSVRVFKGEKEESEDINLDGIELRTKRKNDKSEDATLSHPIKQKQKFEEAKVCQNQ
ncbi:hypothetical protein A2U01_0048782, partial [Trifolium medium]|nr:hypothetical protein [Trifolium medium]